MGDLSRRVQEVAEATAERDIAVSPRAGAKAERRRAIETARLDRIQRRGIDRAETSRRTELAKILNGFRGIADDAGDVGTIGFKRLKRFKDRRIRLGRRPRGWIVGHVEVPIQFPDIVRHVTAQLVLCVDGRLYAGLDGALGDRYQIGQTSSPITTWMLTPAIWRMVEDTMPDVVGHLVGALDLEWPSE